MSVQIESFVELADAPPAKRGTAFSKRLTKNIAMKAVSAAEWDELVVGFDGVCQEMTHVFSAARWPGVVAEPRVFTSGGQIVGGVLMMVQKLPLGLGAIAVAKWGPALKDEDRKDAKAIYAGMVELLIDQYAHERNMMISIMPRASRKSVNDAYDYLLWRGFSRGSELLFPDRYIVNLRLADDAQRKSLAQKWRYHLNKSEKSELTFEHAGPEKLEEFDRLYQAMTDRKKFPDHSAYDTVPELMQTSVEGLRPELFLVRHEGEIVAGAIIFKAGKTAVYLYGATNEKALPLRAGYFMQWHIIRWLRDNTEADWYDLGGTDGFQGLHQFKKGLVGDKGVISPVPPVCNYAAHVLPLIAGTAAFAARDGVYQAKRLINWMRRDMARPNQERG